MLNIEVRDTSTLPKRGVSKKTGKPYSFKEQKAYAHLEGKPYPQEIVVSLDDDQPPYREGFYTLAPESFYVGGFMSLAVKPRLIAV